VPWTKVCCRGSGCPSFMVDDNMVLLRDDTEAGTSVLSLTLEEWDALRLEVDLAVSKLAAVSRKPCQ
jgi:hypothetical protein